MPIYLGIDPGAKGSLCFLESDTKKMVFLETVSIEVTPADLRANILNIHRQKSIHMAGIEDVHTIFGMSAGSNFQFGFNVGLLHGIIRTTGIGLELIQPKVWQKAIGAPTGKTAGGPKKLKQAIAAIAFRLYPTAPLYGPKGGLMDGRADALMIAHYLSLKYGGALP